MTALHELHEHIQALYPQDVKAGWEIHDWRNASVIFNSVHPREWEEFMDVLARFRLPRSSILKRGGNKSLIARWLDDELGKYGWGPRQFDTSVLIDDVEYLSPTHEVDAFKNRVAIEVEWNNKDPFYDRDLNNFRLLFDLKAIDLGIIVTRTDELQLIFDSLGRGASYGQSTTHMSKLLPKVDGGGAGGCPVLAFGISASLYVEDDEPISNEELAQGELIEKVAPLLEEDEEE